MPVLRLVTTLLIFLCLEGPSSSADLDRYLVARWSPAAGSLESKPDNFFLEEMDIGGAPGKASEENGLHLKPGKLLYSLNLNSQAHPDLRKAVTIVVRFRVPEPASAKTHFLFGFRSQRKPGDWSDMTLAARYEGDPGTPSMGAYSVLQDGGTLGTGPSRFIPVAEGELLTAAIAFDGDDGLLTFWLNGQSVITQAKGRKKNVKLADFTNFSIGRLKAATGMEAVFVEMQIFSVAFTPEWMAEIAAEPVR